MNKILKNIVLVIGILGAMFLLGNFKEENNFDRYFKSIDLTQNKKIEYEIDINKMGQLKRYLQPEVLSLHLRLKNEHKFSNLSFKFENLQAIVSQNSKKSEWKEIIPGEILKTEGKNILLNLEVSVPSNTYKVYNFNTGKIFITSNDKIVKEIRLNFVDSRYK